MKKFLSALLFLSVPLLIHATSILPMTWDEQVHASESVFRGTVLATESFAGADGLIYTRTALRVDEGFKGRLPAAVYVIEGGGQIDGRGLADDQSPKFKPGEERLLFVNRRRDGTLFAMQGDASAARLHREKSGALVPQQNQMIARLRARRHASTAFEADLTDQAAGINSQASVESPSGDAGGPSINGLSVDTNGFPYRYPLPDRGEPIPYLVDATSLPAGISQAQALSAVSNAMSAWATASSFKFKFGGIQNFGASVQTITNDDGKIRIQLHDNHNYIPPANILGKGGSWFSTLPLTNTPWRQGGNVAGTEFNVGLNGFVVLEHTNIALQNLTTLTEVLTHEIGHVLGLAHSSNIVTNDTVLTNSVMYWLAHADGRGARLNSYDTNVVRRVHPLNTPPYYFDRVIDATDSMPQPNVPGINELELRGYDLQSTNLTVAITNITTAPPIPVPGTFTLVGNLLRYTPGVIGNGARTDPAGLGYYEYLYARFSDGTNASPYVWIRVVSLAVDGDPFGSDGIPDNWMVANFGHEDPRSNDSSRANDDADGDRLTNSQEYIAGMNPKNSASAQRITILNTNLIQWQARAYELYEVQGTTNLASKNWIRIGNPVVPTNSTGSLSNFYNPATPNQFFRVQKVR